MSIDNTKIKSDLRSIHNKLDAILSILIATSGLQRPLITDAMSHEETKQAVQALLSLIKNGS